jgi:hypothetical protein
MTSASDPRSISLSTMRRWKSSLEQLGAEGDLDLLRRVAEQRAAESRRFHQRADGRTDQPD